MIRSPKGPLVIHQPPSVALRVAAVPLRFRTAPQACSRIRELARDIATVHCVQTATAHPQRTFVHRSRGALLVTFILPEDRVSPCRLVLIAIALAGVGACGTDPPEPDAARDPDRGDVVYQDSMTVALDHLTFEEIVSVAVASLGNVDFGELKRWHVATDGSNRIAVLAAPASRIVILDSLLQATMVVGGQGGGPGEFLRPFYLAVTQDGALAVHDFGKSAILRLDSPGGSWREVHIEPPMISGLGMNGDSLVMGIQPNQLGDTTGQMSLVVRKDSMMHVIDGLNVPRGVEGEFPSCGFASAFPPVFTKRLSWDSRGGDIVYSNDVGYLIEVISSNGRHAIRRGIPVVTATEEMALAELQPGWNFGVRGGLCLVPAEELVAVIGVAPVVPALRSVRLDLNRRIWAERWQPKNAQSIIDVMTIEGTYLGSLHGQSMPVAFLEGDRAVYLEEESDGEQYLRIVRIHGLQNKQTSDGGSSTRVSDNEVPALKIPGEALLNWVIQAERTLE